MGGTEKYHPELGNPVTKEHIGYALTEKWILAQNIQDTIHRLIKAQEYGRPKKCIIWS